VIVSHDRLQELMFGDFSKLELLSLEEERELAKELFEATVTLWAELVKIPNIRKSVAKLDNRSDLLRLSRSWSASSRNEMAKILKDLDASGELLNYCLRLKVDKNSLVRAGERVRPQHERVLHLRVRFAESNLRLVVAIAKKFQFHQNIRLTDLVQDGSVGLMMAVVRYDYRRGFKFSTFSVWWIRHSISRSLQDRSHTIRPPVHIQEAARAIRKATTELYTTLGRKPDEEEISRSTGIKTEKVKQIEQFARREWEMSLSQSIHDDTETSLEEVIPDPKQNLESEFVSECHRQIVRDAVAQLPKMEADILTRRFSLYDTDRQTLEEIGLVYSLTRERIRQIESRALGRLRRMLTPVLQELRG